VRVAVFGANGRTGRVVVRLLLERGHEVTAFVRDASALEGVDAITGDARDPDAVGRALDGADTIVSVLSLRAAEDEPQYSDATRTIVEAAGRAGVRRALVTANNDVLTDREVTGEYAAQAREHRRNRATLEASGLDWTILAAPWVTDDEPIGSYAANLDERGPNRRIGASDFALAVVDALDHDDWIGHAVGVSAP
jgi:putative NADH-flavin reductase